MMKYNYLISQVKSGGRHIEVNRANTCFFVNDTASISVFPKLRPGEIVRNNVKPHLSTHPVVLVENPDTGNVVPLLGALNPGIVSFWSQGGSLFKVPDRKFPSPFPLPFQRKARMRYLGLVRVAGGKVNSEYVLDMANFFHGTGHRIKVQTYVLLEVLEPHFSVWKLLRTDSEEKLAVMSQRPVAPTGVLDNIQKELGLRLGTRLYVLDNIVAFPVQPRDYRALSMPHRNLEQEQNLRNLLNKVKHPTPLFGTSSPAWYLPFFDDRLGSEEVMKATQAYIPNELAVQQKEADMIDSEFPKETRFLRFLPKNKRVPKDRGTRYPEILAARARGETWAQTRPKPKQGTHKNYLLLPPR